MATTAGAVGVIDAAAGVLRAMLTVLVAGGVRVVGVLAEFAEVFVCHGRKSQQHAQHDHDISHQIFLVEVFLSVDHDRWGSQDVRNGVDRPLFIMASFSIRSALM